MDTRLFRREGSRVLAAVALLLGITGIAAAQTDEIQVYDGEIAERGVFNLTWHDWLNLRSLTEVSRVITLAARKRENSRGAHFREDFPEPGDLAA